MGLLDRSGRQIRLTEAGARLAARGRTIGREVVLAADDLWILESWAEVQRLGFDEALGFTVDDLVLYEEMVTQLFQAEAQMLLPRLKGVDPARAAEMIERGLPIVNAFLTGLHRAKIRNFLASIG